MSVAGAGYAAYIRGVPHALPAGEHVLWEGAPDARALATHVFHRRVFFLYFGAMVGWWSASTALPFAGSEYWSGLLVRVGLSVVVLAVVESIARICARTSWYAITNRRVVFKVGMVFPMSINIPFSVVDSAGVARFKDGSGQVRLILGKGHRLAYIALWPHCRGFEFTHPAPILRGLREPAKVGQLLAAAIAEVSDVGHRSAGEAMDPLDSAGSRVSAQPIGA